MITSIDKEIGLRAIERSDLTLLQKWRNSDNLRPFFREYRELPFELLDEWYTSILQDRTFEMFCIIDLKIKKSVGVAGLTYIDFVNRHADLHFYIGDDESWIDRDYAHRIFPVLLEYGFNTMNLNKLWAEVYEIDLKKLDFFQAFGFQIDGCLREHYYFKGKYYTSNILSLLKKDYAN